jgi:hypothetical protein
MFDTSHIVDHLNNIICIESHPFCNNFVAEDQWSWCYDMDRVVDIACCHVFMYYFSRNINQYIFASECFASNTLSGNHH